MQQVKKQLQDAIAELKSGWGINEVKREDLAAVLEKVVAAVDRAAQLPVPDGGGDFDKYFRRVVLARTSYVEEGNAPSPCYPAICITGNEQDPIRWGFISTVTKGFYLTDQNGRRFEPLKKGTMMYNRRVIFTLSDSNTVLGMDGSPLTEYDLVCDNLYDPNWEF